MSEVNANNRFADQGEPDEQFNVENDLLAEDILDGPQPGPIGQLLEKIAALPEIRQEKVISIRNRLSRGQYNPDEHLDVALDRVLEELLQ